MDNPYKLVKTALQAAPACEGLVFGAFTPAAEGRAGEAAGQLLVTFKGQAVTFRVQVVPNLYGAALERVTAEAGRPLPGLPLLLITDYVSPAHAERLRKAELAFLDTAGNASLDLPGLHLQVLGNRRTAPAARPVTGRMFNRAGLKLVFAFLSDPQLEGTDRPALVNRTFRAIRDQTGVALGSITVVMEELKTRGYLLEDKDGKWLVNRKPLLTKWATAYGDRLRPRLVRQRYRSPRARWWEAGAPLPQGVFWGGEVAAARLTEYLRPEVACLYTASAAEPFVLEHDLRPDPQGDVEVLDAFWEPCPHAVRGECVHPLLVYADLLASDIDRNIDAAQRVYDQYLRQIIEAR